MPFISPLLEGDEEQKQYEAASHDQQQRIVAILQEAERNTREAIVAMEQHRVRMEEAAARMAEARKHMSFPFSTSVSWAEKIQRDE